jgi:hypothetical protein
MQIHEITEGIAGKIGRAVANQFTQSQIGVDAFDEPRAPASITPKAPTAAPTAPTAPATTATKPTDPGIAVQTGKRIRLVDPKSKGVYFKTTAGWFNELDQPVVPAGVAYLEKLADAGLGKEEINPGAVAKPVVKPVVKPVAKTAPQQFRKKKKRR